MHCRDVTAARLKCETCFPTLFEVLCAWRERGSRERVRVNERIRDRKSRESARERERERERARERMRERDRCALCMCVHTRAHRIAEYARGIALLYSWIRARDGTCRAALLCKDYFKLSNICI